MTFGGDMDNIPEKRLVGRGPRFQNINKMKTRWGFHLAALLHHSQRDKGQGTGVRAFSLARLAP
jgi:hypothetical protein